MNIEEGEWKAQKEIKKGKRAYGKK